MSIIIFVIAATFSARYGASAAGAERKGVEQIAAIEGRLLWVKNGSRGLAARCPLYPQEQTWSDHCGMSEKCQKATHALRRLADLFNHLVGASE